MANIHGKRADKLAENPEPSYSRYEIDELHFIYGFLIEQWINGRDTIYWDNTNKETVKKLTPLLKRAARYRGIEVFLVNWMTVKFRRADD